MGTGWASLLAAQHAGLPCERLFPKPTNAKVCQKGRGEKCWPFRFEFSTRPVTASIVFGLNEERLGSKGVSHPISTLHPRKQTCSVIYMESYREASSGR